MLEGRLFPILLFLTKVSVVSLLQKEHKLSGRLVIEVDSRCSVDKAPQEVNESGSLPARKPQCKFGEQSGENSGQTWQS